MRTPVEAAAEDAGQYEESHHGPQAGGQGWVIRRCDPERCCGILSDYTSTRPLGFLDAVSLLQKNFLLQVLSGFHQIFRPAEITPIILIGLEGQDVFSVGGEMQIGVDDGENALSSHPRKNTRRNNVDARKSQRLHLP